jgi:hypothetical protein
VKLYLGTDRATWLRDPSMPPLFVARHVLPRVRGYRAVVPWALDSGGFTMLQRNGRWTVTATEYADDVQRICAMFGRPEFAAPMDWMSEPAMIAGGQMGALSFVGTGLSVEAHRELTVANLLELRTLAPDVPWLPVLQGFELEDYLACADLYAAAGVDLELEPIVGVGSVCRRQGMDEATAIFAELAGLGIRLHGFGIKQAGIAASWRSLVSADSMAWSYRARAKKDPCRPGLKSCSHCAHFALAWYQRTLAKVGD